MRRLNPLRKKTPNKKKWLESQQKQIDDFNQTGLTLRAAFPGSFLFNHILVPVDNHIASDGNIATPDVSDIVYANCSDAGRDSGFKNTIVIDAHDNTDLSVTDAIVEVVNKLLPARVVLLGQSTFTTFGDLLKENIDCKVKVDMVEPDWDHAVKLHNIYRQAKMCIFLNSMRVLDAAYTSCDCLLIADDSFCKESVFKVTHKQLVRVGCEVIDKSGRIINPEEIEDIATHSDGPFELIIDNSIAALDRALYQSGLTYEGGMVNKDWLSDYRMLESDPIIIPFQSNNRLSDLKDRKTGVSRKFAKLRYDPCAFFSDSNSAALRILARALCANSAKG